MKNINKKLLKLDEVSELEGKLFKLFNSDKLKELSSKFLSSKIFSTIPEISIKEEIPFKNLEINILLECVRTLGDTEKFFVMLQVCVLNHSISCFRSSIFNFSC